jgi:hypothetical protein
MEQDFDKCKDNTNIMVQKLDDLGYRINRKKIVLIPTKRIVFFGLIIDTEVLADFKFEIHQLISFFESSLINTIDSKLPKEFLKAQTLFLSKFQ